MKPLFVFIDDAPFELDNFQANAAQAFGRAGFIYAQTFEQAREMLAGREPVCFLLDLYGTDPAKSRPAVLARDELESRLAGAGGLARVYRDLDREPDPGNAFLRRLYAGVEAWQGAFLDAAGSLGQGRGYGQGNLEQVRAAYPWAAAAAYSRKALYADAAALCMMGVDLVLQKPQGADDAAVARATRKAAPDLARALYRAVDRRLMLAVMPWALAGEAAPGRADMAPLLARALVLLAAPGSGPAAPLGRELARMLDRLPDFPGIHPCRALAGWLMSGLA